MPKPKILGLICAAILAAGCSSLPRAWGENVGLQADLLGGYRASDHDIVDQNPVVGFELVTSDPAFPVGYELGGLYGSGQEDVPGGNLDVAFTEAYLGLRRAWPTGNGSLRPYVGAGAAWMKTANDLHTAGPTSEFNDRGAGAYVHGGVLWSPAGLSFGRGTEVLLGLDLRGVLGDDVSYGELAFVLGFGR